MSWVRMDKLLHTICRTLTRLLVWKQCFIIYSRGVKLTLWPGSIWTMVLLGGQIQPHVAIALTPTCGTRQLQLPPHCLGWSCCHCSITCAMTAVLALTWCIQELQHRWAVAGLTVEEVGLWQRWHTKQLEGNWGYTIPHLPSCYWGPWIQWQAISHSQRHNFWWFISTSELDRGWFTGNYIKNDLQ